VAGEIDAGPPHRIGQRVLALTRFGGYSDVAVVPAKRAIEIPPRMSFAEAAAIPVNWLTAWHMLIELCNVKRGQRVLVHAAAGGVGTAAVQICRRVGAEVIGTASGSKHARLRELGLTHAIDYRRQDFEEVVKGITGGHGVHVVLDAVGGASIKKGWRCLAPTGKLVVFGASSVMQGPVGMIASVLQMTPFWPLKVMQENKALIGSTSAASGARRTCSARSCARSWRQSRREPSGPSWIWKCRWPKPRARTSGSNSGRTSEKWCWCRNAALDLGQPLSY